MIKLRFVQGFSEANREQFLAYEAQFAQLERDDPEFPQGKRYLVLTGRDASSTLIWEYECESLSEATKTLEFLKSNDRHEDLFRQAAPYLKYSYTEIYQSLDF